MKRRKSKKVSIALTLVAIVFVVMIVSILSAGLIAFILSQLGVWDLQRTAEPSRGLYVLVYISVFMGVVIAALFSQRSVKPIRELMKATDRVARGDFTVHVDGNFVFELDALAQSFNTMAKELQSIETLRSDFVRNFSHEFKTPIISIRGFAKLLREGNVTEEEKQEYLKIIIEESERLEELATNILTLSKIEHTEIVSEQSRFDLSEQIRLAIIVLEPKWSLKSLLLDIELDEEVYVCGNKNMLQQVWMNLLDNAIKFSNQEGKIQVSLVREGQEVCVRIEDEGLGMDRETLTHMYEKFYQRDSSHTLKGNGLGLAIVKGIIELHQGSIEGTSAPGEGTCFSVYLPVDNRSLTEGLHKKY